VIDAARGTRPPVRVFGTDYPTPDGTAIRDYIHVTDLATAHVGALDYLRKGGATTAINLGTGVGRSVREVIQTVEGISGRKVPAEMSPRRAGDPPALVANPQKAKDVLGWSARYDLSTIIEHAWKWQTRNDKK
jgi:UDP-glucose 4-epimerase